MQQLRPYLRHYKYQTITLHGAGNGHDFHMFAWALLSNSQTYPRPIIDPGTIGDKPPTMLAEEGTNHLFAVYPSWKAQKIRLHWGAGGVSWDCGSWDCGSWHTTMGPGKIIGEDDLLDACQSWHDRRGEYSWIWPNCRTFAHAIAALPAPAAASRTWEECMELMYAPPPKKRKTDAPQPPQPQQRESSSKGNTANTVQRGSSSRQEINESTPTWKIAKGIRTGSGATGVGALGEVMKLEDAKAMCKEKGWIGFTFYKRGSKVWFKSSITDRKKFVRDSSTDFYEINLVSFA